MNNRCLKIVAISLFILLNFQRDAYAYLDPGSGSFIYQLLIASLLGALFAFKTFWRKFISAIKAFLSKIYDR